MLDLDLLARDRALSLNENEDQWRKMLWSPSFQALSARMSDGEVVTFLTSCQSLTHLENAIQFVNGHPHALVVSPYSIMIDEAQKADLGLGDWIRTLRPKPNPGP